MVNIKVKVGPKGQIIIPKVFREAYGIKEGDFVIIEPLENGLLIKRRKTHEEIIENLEKIKKDRKNMKAIAKLGELAKIDLEVEFNEDFP